jgi:hypothetical protein
MTTACTSDHACTAVTQAERVYHRLSPCQRFRIAYLRTNRRRGVTKVVRFTDERTARSFCRNHGLDFPEAAGERLSKTALADKLARHRTPPPEAAAALERRQTDSQLSHQFDHHTAAAAPDFRSRAAGDDREE